MKTPRNRFYYFILLLLTIILGLSSRSKMIPNWIYPYLGDYFYAAMMFFIAGFLFPKQKTTWITIISLLACYGIETLQLYQADWINEIRNNKLGALVLGFGFLWSDIVAYTLGGITCCMIELKNLK